MAAPAPPGPPRLLLKAEKSEDRMARRDAQRTTVFEKIDAMLDDSETLLADVASGSVTYAQAMERIALVSALFDLYEKIGGTKR